MRDHRFLTHRIHKNTLAGVLTTITLLFASISANAQPTNGKTDKDSRWFVAGSIGYSMVKPDTDCDCYRVSDDNDAGYMLALGYDLSRYFSVEGYFADLGAAEISNAGGQPVGEVGYRDFGVTGLAYFYNQSPQPPSPYYYSAIPRQGLSFYGRFGVGTMKNSTSLPYEQGNSMHVLVGGGVEYAWRDGFGLRLEYTAYDTDAAMLTAGLVKRFGASKPAPVKYGPTVVTTEPTRPERSERTKALLSLTLPVITFQPGSTELDIAAKRQLDQFVNDVSGFFKLRFLIKGYAASEKDEYDNLRISLGRAVTVKNYLLSRGISARRLSSQGLGSAEGKGGERVEIVIR